MAAWNFGERVIFDGVWGASKRKEGLGFRVWGGSKSKEGEGGQKETCCCRSHSRATATSSVLPRTLASSDTCLAL